VVDAYVAAIESLASGRYGLPWPGCADPAFSFGGENYAIVALRVSQEFYDEDDPDGLVENAHELIEAKGTELAGVMLTGVDTRQRPYLITVNSKEGTLSRGDVSDIIDSIALKDTKK
jgi:hypothetical protein